MIQGSKEVYFKQVVQCSLYFTLNLYVSNIIYKSYKIEGLNLEFVFGWFSSERWLLVESQVKYISRWMLISQVDKIKEIKLIST